MLNWATQPSKQQSQNPQNKLLDNVWRINGITKAMATFIEPDPHFGSVQLKHLGTNLAEEANALQLIFQTQTSNKNKKARLPDKSNILLEVKSIFGAKKDNEDENDSCEKNDLVNNLSKQLDIHAISIATNIANTCESLVSEAGALEVYDNDAQHDIPNRASLSAEEIAVETALIGLHKKLRRIPDQDTFGGARDMIFDATTAIDAFISARCDPALANKARTHILAAFNSQLHQSISLFAASWPWPAQFTQLNNVTERDAFQSGIKLEMRNITPLRFSDSISTATRCAIILNAMGKTYDPASIITSRSTISDLRACVWQSEIYISKDHVVKARADLFSAAASILGIKENAIHALVLLQDSCSPRTIAHGLLFIMANLEKTPDNTLDFLNHAVDSIFTDRKHSIFMCISRVITDFALMLPYTPPKPGNSISEYMIDRESWKSALEKWLKNQCVPETAKTTSHNTPAPENIAHNHNAQRDQHNNRNFNRNQQRRDFRTPQNQNSALITQSATQPRTRTNHADRLLDVRSGRSIIDSGANMTVVTDLAALKDAKQVTGPTFNTANGPVNATHSGTATVKFHDHWLVNVPAFLIPSSPRDLISIDDLEKNNIEVNFKTGGICHCIQGTRFASWKRYPTPSPSANVAISLDWHTTLCHANDAYVMKLFNAGKLPLPPDAFVKEKPVCIPCAIGKIREESYSESANNQAQHFGQRISVDISGPHVRALNNDLYFAVLVDSATRFKRVLSASSRALLAKLIVSTVRSMTARTESAYVSLRSDNAPEFTSHEFEAELQSAGITHETSSPYRPQQDGAAEKAIGDLSRTTSVVLNTASLPSFFWPEALRYVVASLGSFTPARNRNIPIDAAAQRPCLSPEKAIPFGSIVSVIKLTAPTAHRDKMDTKGTLAIYMYPLPGKNAHVVAPMVEVDGKYNIGSRIRVRTCKVIHSVLSTNQKALIKKSVFLYLPANSNLDDITENEGIFAAVKESIGSSGAPIEVLLESSGSGAPAYTIDNDTKEPDGHLAYQKGKSGPRLRPRKANAIDDTDNMHDKDHSDDDELEDYVDEDNSSDTDNDSDSNKHDDDDSDHSISVSDSDSDNSNDNSDDNTSDSDNDNTSDSNCDDANDSANDSASNNVSDSEKDSDNDKEDDNINNYKNNNAPDDAIPPRAPSPPDAIIKIEPPLMNATGGINDPPNGSLDESLDDGSMLLPSTIAIASTHIIPDNAHIAPQPQVLSHSISRTRSGAPFKPRDIDPAAFSALRDMKHENAIKIGECIADFLEQDQIDRDKLSITERREKLSNVFNAILNATPAKLSTQVIPTDYELRINDALAQLRDGKIIDRATFDECFPKTPLAHAFAVYSGKDGDNLKFGDGQLSHGDTVPMELRGTISTRKALRSPLADATRFAQKEEIDKMQRLDSKMLTPVHINTARETIRAAGRGAIVRSHFVNVAKLIDGARFRLMKSRCVANGNEQDADCESAHRFFAAGMTPHTLRMVLAIAVALDWIILQADVSNAYIHALIDEPVFLRVPDGFPYPVPPDHVLFVPRAIYGLRQSGKLWGDEFSGFIITLGYKQSVVDKSLFFQNDQLGNLIALLASYVDDVIVATAEPALAHNTLKAIDEKYGLSSKGEISCVLGLQVKVNRDNKTITLHQDELIDEIACAMQVQRTTKVSCPTGTHATITKNMPYKFMKGATHMNTIPESERKDLFRSVLGKMLFIATMTRPDICATVNQLASFSENPTAAHLQTLHTCARFLSSHRWPLILGGTQLAQWLRIAKSECVPIKSITDASWRSAESTEYTARTGLFVSAPGLPLTWRSFDQGKTPGSAPEAEIAGVLAGTTETRWQGHLLQSVGVVKSFFIDGYTDSDPARKSLDVESARPRSLLTAVPKMAQLRQMIAERGELALSRIPGKQNPVDVLTKALKGGSHVICARRLECLDIPASLK